MTQYLDLVDYCVIAGRVLGLDAKTIGAIVNENLADSALHAPRAGFGDVDAYPSLQEKAAVLAQHLVKNHPLPDGNKRSAFESMTAFLELNGVELDVTPDAADVMEGVASDRIDVPELTSWLEQNSKPHTPTPDADHARKKSVEAGRSEAGVTKTARVEPASPERLGPHRQKLEAMRAQRAERQAQKPSAAPDASSPAAAPAKSPGPARRKLQERRDRAAEAAPPRHIPQQGLGGPKR